MRWLTTPMGCRGVLHGDRLLQRRCASLEASAVRQRPTRTVRGQMSREESEDKWIAALHKQVIFAAALSSVQAELMKPSPSDATCAVLLREAERLHVETSPQGSATLLRFLANLCRELFASRGETIGPQTTTALVRIAGVLRDIKGALEVLESGYPHALPCEVLEQLLEQCQSTSNALEYAMKVEAFLAHPSAAAYNTLVIICVENDAADVCIRMLQRMHDLNVPVSSAVGERALTLLCRHSKTKESASLLAVLSRYGLTRRMRQLASQHKLTDASEVFDVPLPAEPDMAHIHFALSPLNPTRLTDTMVCDALQKFASEVRKCLSGPSPDKEKASDWERQAFDFFEKAKQAQHVIGKRTYRQVLQICRLTSNYMRALDYYEESKSQQLCDGHVVCSTIASMIADGALRAAYSVLTEYRNATPAACRDVFVYEATLHVCQTSDDLETALKVRDHISEDGVEPMNNTFVALMHLCAKQNKTELAADLWRTYLERCRSPIRRNEKRRERRCMLSRRVASPYVRLMAHAEKWAEIHRLLEVLEEGAQAGTEVGQVFQILEVVMTAAARAEKLIPAKAAYRIALKHNCAIEGATLRALLDVGICRRDYLLCARVYEQLESRGTKQHVRMVVRQSLAGICNPHSVFLDAIPLLTSLARSAEASESATQSQQLVSVMRFLLRCAFALAREGHLDEAGLCAILRCIDVTDFCRTALSRTVRKETVVLREPANEVVLRTLFALTARHRPSVLESGKVFVFANTVWRYDRLLAFYQSIAEMRGIDPSVEPFELVDRVVRYSSGAALENIRDIQHLGHSVEELHDAISNVLTVMLQHACRDSSGCREPFYQGLLVACLRLETHTESDKPEASKISQQAGDLRSLLSASRSLAIGSGDTSSADDMFVPVDTTARVKIPMRLDYSSTGETTVRRVLELLVCLNTAWQTDGRTPPLTD
eukprot:Rhum_TRINITY_DN4332_c0_g1::Rhum_TRINITY_DN4332_c0_g1_i1::g.13943::m.13943